jgi:hypothetical protein
MVLTRLSSCLGSQIMRPRCVLAWVFLFVSCSRSPSQSGNREAGRPDVDGTFYVLGWLDAVAGKGLAVHTAQELEALLRGYFDRAARTSAAVEIDAPLRGEASSLLQGSGQPSELAVLCKTASKAPGAPGGADARIEGNLRRYYVTGWLLFRRAQKLGLSPQELELRQQGFLDSLCGAKPAFELQANAYYRMQMPQRAPEERAVPTPDNPRGFPTVTVGGQELPILPYMPGPEDGFFVAKAGQWPAELYEQHLLEPSLRDGERRGIEERWPTTPAGKTGLPPFLVRVHRDSSTGRLFLYKPCGDDGHHRYLIGDAEWTDLYVSHPSANRFAITGVVREQGSVTLSYVDSGAQRHLRFREQKEAGVFLCDEPDRPDSGTWLMSTPQEAAKLDVVIHYCPLAKSRERFPFGDW